MSGSRVSNALSMGLRFNILVFQPMMYNHRQKLCYPLSHQKSIQFLSVKTQYYINNRKRCSIFCYLENIKTILNDGTLLLLLLLDVPGVSKIVRGTV